MGLEALPARFDLLFRPSRPVFSCDAGADGLRTLLTRRFSDVESCSGESTRSIQRHTVSKANADGVPATGFQIRSSWSEKGSRQGSSASLRSQSPWLSQGVPEQSGGPLGLFRWKSDGPGLMRATRSEDFAGDRWRRPEDELCEVETSYQLFEKLDLNVMSPPLPDVQEVRRAWLRNGPTLYEPKGTADREQGESRTAATGASAVDVTAPSFVLEKSKFLDRREYPGGGLPGGPGLSYVDRQVERIGSVIRPASLQRKGTGVYMSRDVDMSRDVEVSEQALDSSQNVSVVPPIGLGERAECVSLPASLRNLKKRNGRGVAGNGVCAIKKAFDSMVFMIRALQTYTLHMRKVLVSDTDVQHLLSLVHREMHSSFVWLFQQVFSCTPTLMVSVMILLANFTVFSLGKNVAIAAVVSPEAPTELVSILKNRANREGPVVGPFDGKNTVSFVRFDRSLGPSLSSPADFGSVSAGHGFGNYGPGGIGGRSVVVAGGEEGDYNARGASTRNAMFSERESKSVDIASGKRSLSVPGEDARPVFLPNLQDVTNRIDGRSWTAPRQEELKSGEQVTQEELRSLEQRSYQTLLRQAASKLELKPGEPYHYVELEQETLRRLVAPVFTKMETDKYLCFDRTDLEYQHAIDAEPANPMLLANYAQFLYVVRHDNNRAERFFHRALRVDAEDGDILGRWASFLWLALKDRPRADSAYRAAIAIDPLNPFHAGSYAHFLWHAGEEESPRSCHPQ